MTTDHLTAEQRSASESVPVFLGDSGWGFGVEVIPANGGDAARYGWGGGLGTFWYSVPQDETVAIVMTQRLPPSPDLAGDFFGLLSAPG